MEKLAYLFGAFIAYVPVLALFINRTLGMVLGFLVYGTAITYIFINH